MLGPPTLALLGPVTAGRGGSLFSIVFIALCCVILARVWLYRKGGGRGSRLGVLIAVVVCVCFIFGEILWLLR
jgi:hypothetical protein